MISSVAESVELCLFDDTGVESRHQLEPDDGYVWRGRVSGAKPGTQYGFRVHGPWRPEAGVLCNPSKLLLDPYARAISGGVSWSPALQAADPTDSAPYVPRSVVCGDEFDWHGDKHPRVPLADSVIYELHVKGYTQLHPDIPDELRGTYLGLAQPAIIDHLRRLGVTAVELLPVHQFVHDEALVARGLRNYWGYQSIGYFAPHNQYAASGDRGGQVDDFRAMVRGFHAAGIEVILDVVFNHTAEGGADGPSLCFRGLDNPAYYRLQNDLSRYVDDTGCGNTFDTHRPTGLRLVMDSLRYWAQTMHVDGFRFDLAASLARGQDAFDPYSAFLDAVGQDPVLSEVKLIAEPWDTGAGGYDLGEFPSGWSEWNGRYRDTIRDFWRGTSGMVPDLATRISGSSDLYGARRRPQASINFVTVHDGFTLADLTAYDVKHNDANGEDNRDGTDDNRSWNCGVEGPTDDPAVVSLRNRQRRNFLATLLLSQGVPLLLGGDELGRSQNGDNNAYCQDNEISWVDWPAAAESRDLIDFVATACRLRRQNPEFRSAHFLRGADVRWLRPDGEVMTSSNWEDPDARALIVSPADSSFLMLFNGWWEPLRFRLPMAPGGCAWSVALYTSEDGAAVDNADQPTVSLDGRSLMVLQAASA